MLKGDLSSTPLAPLLVDLADDEATGCLHITESGGEEATVYYKSGLVYAVSVPGTRPQLGAKLVSSGALAPEALAEALEAQRSELQGWRLGELLVHLGYVDQPVVEAFVKEQVSEALWDLMRWTDGQWKFRKNIKAREDVGPPMVVVELLQTLRDRGYEWETISAVVHGPAAIPVLSARGDSSAETTLDNDAWSMLCKIDGERSVAELARDCGYTLFEAGHVIVSLVQAGLVDIAEDIDVTAGADYSTTDSPGEEDSISRLARLVTEVTGDHSRENGNSHDNDEGGGGGDDSRRSDFAFAAASSHIGSGSSESNPMVVPLHRQSNESFAASMARVSSALSEVLGEAIEDDSRDTMQHAQYARVRATKSDELQRTDPEWEHRKRAREAAGAELARAQELVETMRPGQRTAADVPDISPGEIPKIVSTETERRRADEREAEQARRHASELEARAAANEFAKRAAEAADRHADEQEVKRLAAVQAALHADAEAANRAAAEAAAALAAQEAEVAAREAARLEAERAEAEESAWAEHQEREETARLAAEQEAERVAAEYAAAQAAEAERLAAEEAARLAAEEAECQAAKAAAEHERALAAEAERLAAEEAERLAAEEAERLAAEEAERLAAESAAEQERQAAEKLAELERQAAAEAAAEQERQAAAEAAAEQERLAQEAAAEAAEREAAEVAAAEAAAAEATAEAEREREAAAEVARLAAEAAQAADAEATEAETEADEKAERAARRKAEKLEAEQAAAREDEAAAATALLVELAATAEAEPDVDDAAEEPETDDAATDEAVADDEAEVDDHPGDGRWNEAETADTAALLRELSSLGVDDGPRRGDTPPPANRAPRAPTPDKKVKKKIGLFGL